MAAVMTGYAETGISHPTFVRRRLSDGAWWYTGTPAFESYNASHVASYGIAAAEAGATGVYAAADPDPATEGDYLLVAAAGASLAVADLTTGVRWQDRTAVFAGGDVDGFSLEGALKLCLAALAGKLSGAATAAVVIRAADDSKDRITATVDADGNRTSVALDATG